MSAAPWPKRREMTFTSSGWETRVGMLFHVLSLAGAIGVEDLVDLHGGEVVVEVVVDLDGGGPATGADALDFFEREGAIRSDLFVPDAELGLAVVKDLVAPAQHAGNIGADLHVVLA